MTPSKTFYLKVTRTQNPDPDQQYVVGDFAVEGIRESNWLDRLLERIRGFPGLRKPRLPPVDQIPDTNVTIGLKITTDHYADLLGMTGTPAPVRGILAIVPAPRHDQIVEPTQVDHHGHSHYPDR